MLGDEMIDEASRKMALVVAAKGGRPGSRAAPAAFMTGLQNLMPMVVKNQNDEVSQSPVSAVKSSPPSTGRVQPGRSRLGSDSIFAVNTP